MWEMKKVARPHSQIYLNIYLFHQRCLSKKLKISQTWLFLNFWKYNMIKCIVQFRISYNHKCTSQETCEESLTFPTHIEAIINNCWFSTPFELFEWKCVHWEEWKSKLFHPTTLGYDICVYIFTFCNAHDYDVAWVMVMSWKYFCFWHFITIHCTIDLENTF